MPLGQVPVLEIPNEPLLVQSLAIARLIAKETRTYFSCQNKLML
jgi:glutathione S-transferase